MRHFTPETEHGEFYDITTKMIWWQPITAWIDWFVAINGEGHLYQIYNSVWSVWSDIKYKMPHKNVW
jgi:hypothetical protein